MDYGKILVRAFEITRTHRALWVFGVLLALFGGGGTNFNPGNFGGGNGGTGRGNSEFPSIAPGMQQAILAIVLALICFVVIWFVLSIILRFVSRAALIGQVHELETQGTLPAVRQGFSLGAARFWSLLGIALTINIPLALVSLILILVAALPILVTVIPLISAGQRSPDQLVGVVLAGLGSTFVLICCVVILLSAISFVVYPFYEFITRACVIGKRGVMDSIREGYRIVRANLGNVAVLYILAIGIGIAFGGWWERGIDLLASKLGWWRNRGWRDPGSPGDRGDCVHQWLVSNV